MAHTTIIRNLSEQDLAALDDAAKRSRLSREEYLRELIHHDATDHLLSVDAVRRLRLPNED